jgi:hypothetical protein
MTRRFPPKGRARGLLAVALASAVALSAVARSAVAEVTQRVAIRVPTRADPLLEEALVRVRGELGAMGLEAEVQSSVDGAEAPNSEAGVGGTLIVERDGAWIRIRALGPASAVPAVQELDARRADVTAEVVAVRAVEALRAVMTGLPDRAAPPPKPAPKPTPPPPKPAPPPAPSGPALSLAPRGESALSVWLGANGRYDVEPGRPALGAELGLFWGRSSLFAGALLSTSLIRTTLSDVAGTVDVRRSAALASAGFALQLSRAVESWFLLGGGIVRHAVDGNPSAGYIGVANHHEGALISASLGASAWLSQRFGGYFKLDASVSSDAPAVRVTAREIAILERPSLGASLGLVIRAPFARVPPDANP